MEIYKQLRHNHEEMRIKNQLLQDALDEINVLANNWLAAGIINSRDIVSSISLKAEETLKRVEKLADTRV